ncbi:MAG: 1,4-alpha-glucan branching enzyme, partial [Desulfocapsa sp.]|nr:1,4-alpha-glucan branching enzyme [Desulfocapsa sp.]
METNSPIDRLLRAEHYDPFQVLGVHFSDQDTDSALIRCFQPHARFVSLLIDGEIIPMERVRDEGIFEATIDRGKVKDGDLDPYTYQYKIIYNDGVEKTINDPYRFMPILSEEDRFLFNFGTNYELYNHIGAHPGMYSQIHGTIFRVWAPSATRVSVLGNFNSWDGRVHSMRSLGTSGIWELFI